MTTQSPLGTEDAFDADPGYLDTASVGIPPRSAVDSMRSAISDWQKGRARPQDYDELVDRARRSYGRLVGVEETDVSIGSQASALIGLVAASLPDDSRVVLAEGDFTSVIFPFLAQADRGVEVVTVPLQGIAEAIDRRTSLVAVSAVQSSSGIVADLEGIAESADANGARTLVDATQASGWLPFDAARFDVTVCAAYKWLLSPRGAAFMTLRPEMVDRITPHAAGWYAGDDIWSSIYGGPLRLAPTARRLDVSPAWLSWVGCAPALDLIERIGIDVIHSHDVALANHVRTRLGIGAGDSAIVRVEIPGADERITAAGLRASTRAGAVRLSFHLHNTVEDAERAADALTGSG